MNVGIVTTWEERGASYVSKQYYDALSTEFNVNVFARGGTSKRSDSPFLAADNCYRSKGSNRIYSTYINKREFLSWLKRHSIKVALFNEQNWWPPILWCKEMGIYVGTYIDYYTETTIPFFDLYDFLICNTERHYSAFSWHPHAYYIPWGTNVDVFCPSGKKGGERIVFFHSSGMSPHRKGTDLVINAFNNVIADRAKLIIHSQIDLGAFIYSTLGVKKEMLDKNIEFIEKTVSAPGLYYLGDVYVYPSRLDGLGLTVAEALSCGLPVIVPDDGPMNEFIADSRGKLTMVERRYARSDGYYWPMNNVDVDDLRKNMQYYLDNPSAIRDESRNARDFALKELDWRKRQIAVNEIFWKCFDRPMRENADVTREIVEGEKSLIEKAKRFVMEVDSFVKLPLRL